MGWPVFQHFNNVNQGYFTMKRYFTNFLRCLSYLLYGAFCLALINTSISILIKIFHQGLQQISMHEFVAFAILLFLILKINLKPLEKINHG
jgi:hypothetical protein